MNLDFFNTFLIIISLLLLGLLIYAFRRIYGNREDPDNGDIIINLLSNYCDGYALGVKNSEEGSKEKVKITMMPRDINYIKAKEKEFLIKQQDVFVKKELYIPLRVSAHRNIFLALPERGDHLPDDLKKHPFGRKIMEYIEERRSEIDEKKITRTREEVLYEITQKAPKGGGEMMKDYLRANTELMKDIVKVKGNEPQSRPSHKPDLK